MVERDFEANPYTPHEQRVAKYLDDVAGIGGGDDPIEFLIASHEMLRKKLEIKTQQQQLAEREIVSLIRALEDVAARVKRELGDEANE